MTAKEIYNWAVHTRGQGRKSGTEKNIGTEQELNSKELLESLRADEFLELMDVLGYSVEYPDQETGELLKVDSDKPTARETFVAAAAAKQTSQTKIADRLHWSRQTLYGKWIRGGMRTEEYITLMGAAGYNLEVVDRKTGRRYDDLEMELPDSIPWYGVALRGMSEGVSFCTSSSTSLANSFFADGLHAYGPDGRAEELYVDAQGRYFFAQYFSAPGERPKLRATSVNVAAAFLEKYGTDQPPKGEKDGSKKK